jgi:hypothetical protein
MRAAQANVHPLLLSHRMVRSLKTLDENIALIRHAEKGRIDVAADLRCYPINHTAQAKSKQTACDKRYRCSSDMRSASRDIDAATTSVARGTRNRFDRRTDCNASDPCCRAAIQLQATAFENYESDKRCHAIIRELYLRMTTARSLHKFA